MAAIAKKDRVRDYLIYVCVGLFVVCGAAVYGIYAAKHGIRPEFKGDWTLASTTAAVAFGYVLKNSSLKHTAKFWAAWSCLLLLHFVLLLSILSRMDRVPLIWGAVLAPAELMALTFVLDKFLNY